MDDHGRFVDEVVARELARTSNAEPLDGFEERLLAKLLAHGAGPRSLRPHLAWRWVAVALAAVVAGVVALWPTPNREAPALAIRQAPASPSPTLPGEVAESTPTNTNPSSASGTAPAQERRVDRTHTSQADALVNVRGGAHGRLGAAPAEGVTARPTPGVLPKGDPRPPQFPTPAGPSDPERLALQLAGRPGGAEPLLALQNRELRPLVVTAITIHPLPLPGIEQEPLR